MEHSFYMPVSAIRGLFSQLLTVPLYRQPNTLGWPYLDAPIDPGNQWSSDTFLPLRNLLMLLPNFMPSAVQELLQTFQINGTHFYNLSALTHLREKGILPGTRSDDMSSLYDWPLEWEPRASLDSPFYSSLQSSDAENWQLLRKLGGHFLKRLIAALLAPNGHFPSLLLSTIWGIQGGFTSLCVQGIFGSGKTYCASLLLVLVSTVLQLPTVLTAEPNLPLATAAETISDLLRDAPEESRAAYARVLAYGVPKLTPIDVLPIDRPKLFQADSPLMCLILTHGSVLRDLCRDYPQLRSFLEACRLAINDESQQGGHAGFTILATCLARACLQIFTGDREQTRAGTGGDLLREESLLQRLAHKGIGFLDGPPPKLPSEMLASFASALADECSFPLIGTSGPDPFPLLAALTTQVLPPSCHPKTVRAAEGHVPTAGVLLHLILPHSLRCPADTYLTQVAMHYPHLHRPDGSGVAYGHYEEPPRQIRDSRLPIDMQGRTHPISGYRLVHWSPDLKPGRSNLLATRCSPSPPSSPFSRHVQSALITRAPSSYSLRLTMTPSTIFKMPLGFQPPITLPRYMTSTSPFSINKTSLQPTRKTSNCLTVLITPALVKSRLASTKSPQLEAFATLKAIVEIVHSCPKGFTSYCAISNTVKAIGIGGSASLFVTVKMSSFLADSQEAEARNLVALTRSKGLCLLLFPTTHVHPTGPLHSLRTLCALRHGMFHIGKDRVDLDSFAAFLTQPDTVEFAHDGITIDSRAPFTRESWLFTHQITSYGAWTFLPLALRLTMHTARFELTLALRQEVPKPSCFQVTPDLFHWQGHLLDGVRVTLSFGIGCLELASDTFVYVRFPYPEPGHAPQLEVKGWTLTPDCGSYFFSRASHSLGHLHPSRPGVVDPSDYARPASLLKWPATSPATRSRYAHLPHHHTPDAPPKLLPAASIPYYHMGMDQLCQPAVLNDKDLVPSLWLAAFAALIGTSLTNEHNALLQHPLIPPQFPSRVIAPLLAGDVDTVTDYVTEILACTGPSWTVKNRRPRSSGSQSMHPFKSSRVPLWILSLPGLTISMLGSPNW